MDGELDFLKQKVDAGADFIVTQLFYDVEGFTSWIGKVRAKGINRPSNFAFACLTVFSTRDHRSCYSRNHAYTDLRVVPSDDEALWNACSPGNDA